MPIYEYEAELPGQGCEKCMRGFEYLQGIEERPLSHCPSCGKRIKRIISWCRAAVIEPLAENAAVERKIGEYERDGRYSHAAELADKHSHKIKDSVLKERALENYKKAGYNFDAGVEGDT